MKHKKAQQTNVLLLVAGAVGIGTLVIVLGLMGTVLDRIGDAQVSLDGGDFTANPTTEVRNESVTLSLIDFGGNVTTLSRISTSNATAGIRVINGSSAATGNLVTGQCAGTAVCNYTVQRGANGLTNISTSQVVYENQTWFVSYPTRTNNSFAVNTTVQGLAANREISNFSTTIAIILVSVFIIGLVLTGFAISRRS